MKINLTKLKALNIDEKKIEAYLLPIKPYVIFFKRVVIISILLNIECIRLIVEWGFFKVLIFMLLEKLVIYLISFYLINIYRKNNFPFYQNLGISKLRLFLISILFDNLLFVSILGFCEIFIL